MRSITAPASNPKGSPMIKNPSKKPCVTCARLIPAIPQRKHRKPESHRKQSPLRKKDSEMPPQPPTIRKRLGLFRRLLCPIHPFSWANRCAHLRIRLQSEASCTVSKNLRLPFWPFRIFRVRQASRNSSRKLQKHRRRMFVRRNWIAKGNISEILQRVRQRIVRGITGGPQPVPLRKLFRRKRGQPQQIIRSVLDHIDAQIVACVNEKVWPPCIAKLQPA